MFRSFHVGYSAALGSRKGCTLEGMRCEPTGKGEKQNAMLCFPNHEKTLRQDKELAENSDKDNNDYIIMCISIHVYAYKHAKIHACSGTHTYMYICTYMYTCMYVYIYMYVDMDTDSHRHRPIHTCIIGERT